MATNTPQDNFQKTALRLPKDLHASLYDAAAKSGRSYNAEIVARLQASFDAAPSPHSEVAEELAQSRAQTITAMEFLQGSLCETVQAMYPLLPRSQQRDRTFTQAQRLASSLLAGARPGDYLLSRSELLAANHALARFMEEVQADIATHEKKQARPRRPGAAAR